MHAGGRVCTVGGRKKHNLTTFPHQTTVHSLVKAGLRVAAGGSKPEAKGRSLGTSSGLRHEEGEEGVAFQAGRSDQAALTQAPRAAAASPWTARGAHASSQSRARTGPRKTARGRAKGTRSRGHPGPRFWQASNWHEHGVMGRWLRRPAESQ